MKYLQQIRQLFDRVIRQKRQSPQKSQVKQNPAPPAKETPQSQQPEMQIKDPGKVREAVKELKQHKDLQPKEVDTSQSIVPRSTPPVEKPKMHKHQNYRSIEQDKPVYDPAHKEQRHKAKQQDKGRRGKNKEIER